MERDDLGGVGGVDEALSALETTLGGVGSMAASFDAELRRIQVSLTETTASSTAFSGSISRGVRQAFDGLVFDGMKLSDALQGLATSILNATYSAAIKPVTNQIGSLIAGSLTSLGAAAFAKGGLMVGGRAEPYADGAAFAGGRVRAFARGGVVTAPTTFPMRGGTGLMGEAGPEAIMPLTRGPDGSLGVRAAGGSARPVQVVMNISTPDVAAFQRSQSQVAARMSRALARGDRNR